MLQKRCHLPTEGLHNSRSLQQIVSCTQTGKKWCVVIDLSVLNGYMLVPTFKMETAEIIRNSVTKERLVLADLKDVYFHVPIHPDSQHLLCFHVDKRTYQFKALPFGLATAPLEFTRIVKEAKLILQSRGIQVPQYLDN